MDLSIVIPAFEESGKIGRDIKEASRFLIAHKLAGEIIVVDDGSKDNTTEVVRKTEAPAEVPVQVLRYERHRGKGYAVRTGIEHSIGDYVMFADSGSCVPYEDALRGLDLIKSNKCDIAHGSRKISGCNIGKAQNLHRRVCSAIFHCFVVHSLNLPAELTDTQCGFKIYKGDAARRLYSQCKTDGFVFDIEVIMLARKEGLRIKEFPISWTCDLDTRLSPSRSSWKIFKELLKIKKSTSEQSIIKPS